MSVGRGSAGSATGGSLSTPYMVARVVWLSEG